MENHHDILVLLQDIKDLLYGMALLLAGGFFSLTGATLDGWGLLLLAVGVFVFFAGALWVCGGYHPYEVVERTEQGKP